jgi:hypothetical protein
MDQNNLVEPKALFFPWVFIAQGIATGALSYVGGRILASVMGEPSLGDIQKMIKQALVDLTQYILEQLREIVTEDRVHHLEALAISVETNLRRYANLPKDIQRRNRYLIEEADKKTSEAIPACLIYKLNALPVLVVFISLRVIAIKALHEGERDTKPLRDLAKELSELLGDLKAMTNDYYNLMLEPERRLSPVFCGVNRTDGPFPTETTWCCFKEDNKDPVESQCVGSTNSSEAVQRPRAEALRREQLVRLSNQRETIDMSFIAPIKEVFGTLDKIVLKLSK